MRVELRPALRTAELLKRLADLGREGRITKRGYLRPGPAAWLLLDFPQEGHAAARPPVGVQCALARAIVALAKARAGGTGTYVFVDEWDVRAPAESVFAALADARTYPDWWRPVYERVEADGPPALGRVAPAIQGAASVSPEDELACRPARTAAHRGWRRGRRPAGTRHLDTDAVRGRRHAPPIRLDGLCRQTAPAGAHPRSPPAVSLEPQLGHRTGKGGPGALRPAADSSASGRPVNHDE